MMRNGYNRKAPKSIKKKINYLIVGTVSSVMLTTTALAVYIVDGNIATSTPIINAAMTTVSTTFETQMTAMDAAIATAIESQTQLVNSSIRVWTKQKSVSANEVALNDVTNSQKKMAALQAQMQVERRLETIENKGSYGQGYKTCTVLSDRETTDVIVKNGVQTRPYLASSTVIAATGSYSDSYGAFEDMNSTHKAKYCTDSQAAAGYCSATDKQGWNLMTSTLFTPTVQGSDVYEAQNSLINNMVGMPDDPIPKELVGAPNASNYIILKQRKDAIISPAIYSLKAIQSEFLGVKGVENKASISPVDAINKEVKRYLGSGSEYQEWNKVLVAASERGVLKEVLQVQALDLYLLARQYHANEREELLLTGIVASTQQLNANSGNASSKDNQAFRTTDDYQRAVLDGKKIVSDFSIAQYKREAAAVNN